ncbi:MAG: histidine--tRNA ligase [bacterium]
MSLKVSRGTQDFLPRSCKKLDFILRKARAVFEHYAFQEISTPIFENTAVFMQGIGEDTDIIQKEMYTFQDKGQRSLTLRPEGTAAVVRACIEHRLLTSSQKLFYVGPFFRYERPQAGRYRQFHQIGAEYLGESSPYADAELIILAYRLFSSLGLKDLHISINTIGDSSSRPAICALIRDFFTPYHSQLSAHVQQLLRQNPLRILDSKDPFIQTCLERFSGFQSCLNKESLTHYQCVLSLLDLEKIPYKETPFLVRGLDYYTHTTFEICSEQLGAQSAICGGGRYDHLVEKLKGPATPAVGFAFGLERLLTILDQENSFKIDTKPLVVFIPLGIEAEQSCFSYMEQCRKAGIACHRFLGLTKLSQHLKHAHNLNATACVIIGENELQTQQFLFKHMDSGEQSHIPIDQLISTMEAMK